MGNFVGLERVDFLMGIAGLHGTKSAASCAGLAQEHKCRRSAAPTLGEVRAVCLLTNRL